MDRARLASVPQAEVVRTSAIERGIADSVAYLSSDAALRSMITDHTFEAGVRFRVLSGFHVFNENLGDASSNLSVNIADTASVSFKATQRLGVPYDDRQIAEAPKAVQGRTELDALVAYLQVLGTAVK